MNLWCVLFVFKDLFSLKTFKFLFARKGTAYKGPFLFKDHFFFSLKTLHFIFLRKRTADQGPLLLKIIIWNKNDCKLSKRRPKHITGSKEKIFCVCVLINRRSFEPFVFDSSSKTTFSENLSLPVFKQKKSWPRTIPL